MEEKSLRITGADTSFFNKITNTLSKILIPTKIGINGMFITIKRNNLLKAYENYTSGTGTAYGTTYSYSRNRWYPLQWKKDNGIDGESDQTQVTEYATESNAKSQENDTLTVTQTFWSLTSNEMKSNFISADTRDTSKSNSMYYELLCNNGGSLSSWLASRCVNTDDFGAANFGLSTVTYGYISFSYMFYSYGITGDNFNNVRPIVSLKSDIINIDAGYDENNGGWQLKD